ncbi:hypothetical protein RB597_000074 [Gaeumannomyces tritici]
MAQDQAAFWSLSTAAAAESMLVPRHSNYSAEHGNGPSTESIIGVDGRMKVYHQDYQDGGPFRSVVKIQARFGKVWMMASGWLIEPNLVITAGHVIYDWSQNLGQTDEVRCYIGYHGRASIPTSSDDNSKVPSPVQCRVGAKVVTTAQWVTNNDERTRTKDVAFIQLDKPFIGNLNLFKYVNTTPVSGNEVILGVVGYPGDKSLGSEGGAEMYEQFLPTDYNIATNKNHMIEYQISTFGGQSGAPIISREDGLVIGTHCYGGGGPDGNSGNAIGGKYGNNYNSFIDVFSRQIAASKGKFVLVPLKTAGPNGNGGNGSNGNHNGESYLSGGDGTESIFDIIGSIAGVASSVLPIAGSMLGGPVGGAIGSLAGSILGSLTGAESMEDDSLSGPASNAAPDRAVLAEAALQTVMALQGSPQADYIIDHIKQTCQDSVPDVDKLADSLSPILTKHVAQMTVRAMNQNNVITHPPTEAVEDRRPLKVSSTESGMSDFMGKALYECLITPTIPVAGEEGFIDGLGSLISKGIQIAKPIATQVAKSAIEKYGPKVISAIVGKIGGAESTVDDGDMLNKGAVKILLNRAFVADASLQALSSLSKSDLQKLKLDPQVAEEHGLHEEGVWDFFKSAAQTIGPLALQAGKVLAPIVLGAVKDKIVGGKSESAVGGTSGGGRSGQHLSVRDRLGNARKRSMPRLNSVFNQVSEPGSHTEQAEEYSGSGGDQRSYSRARSIDRNPDGLLRSQTPPPLVYE